MDGMIVIKCGGSMIDTLSTEFFDSIKKLQSNGLKPIIVHGGGPAINKMLESLQIESEFVNGLRKTTDEVMNVVEMVLSGSITNQLVRGLQANGINAIGITGSDRGLLKDKAIDKEKLGFVSDITAVNETILYNLTSIGLVPVISPIAINNNGDELLNINADTAAAAIAVAVKASKILFVTDVPGVLKNNEIVETATSKEMLSLIDDGTISGGMIPKVKAALHSLEGGMTEAMIVSGQSYLLDGKKIVGTTIRKELEIVN